MLPVATLLVFGFVAAASGAPLAPATAIQNTAALPANPNSNPDEFVRAGNYVFFTADDGAHGREVWRTDGTPDGTVLVRDIWEGPESSNPNALVAAGDAIFFVADTPGPANNSWLWISHGSSDTTYPVESTDAPVRIDRYFSHHGTLGPDSRFYFKGTTITPHAQWVWSCSENGQAAYSFPLPANPIGPIRLNDLISTGDQVFVWGCYNAWQENAWPQEMMWVWRSENQPPQTINLGHSVVNAFLGFVHHLALLRAREFTSEHGFELWVSDGTQEGTHLLKDIYPGIEHGIPEPLDRIVLRDRLFFGGDDGSTGRELWVSDGTEAGTYLVKDSTPGLESSEPGIFAATDDAVYYQGSDGATGRELWVSDGTAVGTHLVSDIEPGAGSSKPFALCGAGDRVYFTAEDTVHGGELWVSDGTKGGTRLVRDIVLGSEGSWPRHMTALGDHVIFRANDGVHGIELWITDGTEAGTSLLKDIYPNRGQNPSSNPQSLTPVGDLLFFVINDASHGAELWRSDGSSAGTFLVKDIYPGPPSSRPSQLTAINGRLFFQAEDGTYGLEMWVSDGTEEGTRLFADLNPGEGSSSPHEFVGLPPDHFYFVATDESGENRLHSFCFTDTAPKKFDNVRNPTQLTLGTIAGTGPCVYFVGDDGTRGRELWYVYREHDPVLVKDIVSNQFEGSAPEHLTPVENELFFNADDVTHGRELYRTEGNADSTFIIKDLRPPPASED